MFDIKSRTKITCVFSLFLGIYQYKMFTPDSILLSLIGGIRIGKKGDFVPYIEVAEWMFIISFFVLLSVMQLREKIRLYMYEVIRYKTYRCWCWKLYKMVFLYTIYNALMCIIVWYLMDVILNRKISIPMLAIVLFILHLLCCVAMICLVERRSVRNEFIYLPLIIESGTILLACKWNTEQIWFWGTWGMYYRSNYVNQYVGFSVYIVILLELAIIVISYLLSSKGENYNEIIHKDY